GAPAGLPHVRSRGMLRRFADEARHRPLPRHEASDDQVLRARGDMGLVLRGRDDVRSRPGPLHATSHRTAHVGGRRHFSLYARAIDSRIALAAPRSWIFTWCAAEKKKR